MKTTKIVFTLFFFSLLSLLASCVKHYNKIEISSENIDKVERSMRFVRNSLGKSVFDTLAIKQYKIECEIDNNILYTVNDHPNRDSIEKDVKSKFDFNDWFPLRKGIYQTKEGWIILNERLIGKDVKEFMRNALKCKELERLSSQEREKFIDSFVLMLENNVWSCFENDCEKGGKEYCFDYSKDRRYYNEWAVRYLYLKEDTQGNSNIANYLLLDQRNGILLYKNKNGSSK